jgi:hypothetical protein
MLIKTSLLAAFYPDNERPDINKWLYNFLFYGIFTSIDNTLFWSQSLRKFLITVSFVNSLLYFAIYAYFDTIMGIIGPTALSAGLQSFLKVLILAAAGFCTGLIPMLMLAPGMKRSRVDIKNLILLGIVPFMLLMISPGPVSGFIIKNIFSGNESIRELLLYLISRQSLWSVWLGFALGTSVRISFRKMPLRHAVSYSVREEQAVEEKQDEANKEL